MDTNLDERAIGEAVLVERRQNISMRSRARDERRRRLRGGQREEATGQCAVTAVNGSNAE